MRGSRCERERARPPPPHTHRVYIAVRSDDRNDSNHRLTSGIRHSGFRVATPAAIVAVYDCRARSPTLSHRLVLLVLQLFHLVSSLSLALPRSRSYPGESGFLVSLRVSTLLVLSFSLAIFSLGIFLSISPFFSHLSLPLFPLSPSRFLRPVRSRTSPPFSRSLPRSLPVSPPYLSRWSALDPTRYRPHSRAQTTRQRYMYMHSRVHRSPPLPPSPLQLRSAARSLALLRGPEKS